LGKRKCNWWVELWNQVSYPWCTFHETGKFANKS
jgi:hypothetical protein